MKKQISHSLLALLLFMCGLAGAQTGRFIELTVSDTFGLKPVGYIYEISVGDPMMDILQYSGDDENLVQKKGDELAGQAQMKDVTNMLIREKFSYTTPEYFNYSSKYTPSSSVLVTVNNDKDLKKLHEMVDQMKGLSGKIKETNYESLSTYHQQIYKGLFDKAKKRAAEMAAVSGNSIGGLISVTDVRSNDPLGMYAELMKKAAYNYGMGTEPFARKIEEMSMTFKFELK
jgi:hypothetical protein